MEEDIKIIEELKNKKVNISGDMYSIKWFELNEKEKQALENLLKAYKEDELVIEEMTDMLRYYNGNRQLDIFCLDICNNKERDKAFCEYGCSSCIKEYFRNKVKEEKNGRINS